MPDPSIELISRHPCHGGAVSFHRHAGRSTDCSMRFSVFTPPRAGPGVRVPVLYFLSGLTCTEETFMIKSGAQRVAAELGLMLVCPDTSPRVRLPGDDASWDFGLAAGFYLDATEAPWAAHYRMYSYVSAELPALIEASFPADPQRTGIFGHSMGGHGALTVGLRNPQRFRSISAFAPIAAPSRCPWGIKAFTGYLGADRSRWGAYDATEIVARIDGAAARPPILIDQGLADQYLAGQLMPEAFLAASRESGYPVELRQHAGYDHGYYFISTFIEEHLRRHAAQLRA